MIKKNYKIIIKKNYKDIYLFRGGSIPLSLLPVLPPHPPHLY